MVACLFVEAEHILYLSLYLNIHISPPLTTHIGSEAANQLESSDCTCSDTPAIIGGVVAIVILSAATALTVIVIVLVRSRRGDYSTRSKGYEQ